MSAEAIEMAEGARRGIQQPDGRFETEWLASDANLTALADLFGAWIDRNHDRKPSDGIILDMDSSAISSAASSVPAMLTVLKAGNLCRSQ